MLWRKFGNKPPVQTANTIKKIAKLMTSRLLPFVGANVKLIQNHGNHFWLCNNFLRDPSPWKFIWTHASVHVPRSAENISSQKSTFSSEQLLSTSNQMLIALLKCTNGKRRLDAFQSTIHKSSWWPTKFKPGNSVVFTNRALDTSMEDEYCYHY